MVRHDHQPEATARSPTRDLDEPISTTANELINRYGTARTGSRQPKNAGPTLYLRTGSDEIARDGLAGGFKFEDAQWLRRPAGGNSDLRHTYSAVTRLHPMDCKHVGCTRVALLGSSGPGGGFCPEAGSLT